MKKSVISIILFITAFSVYGQNNRTDILQNLEKSTNNVSGLKITATTKSSTRLFGDKNDLTSVITIIPSGTEVEVLGSDSTFLNVAFEDTAGFVFKRHTVITASETETKPIVRPAEQNKVTQQEEPQSQVSRFSYLENKYGTNMAARLVAGKIWKGMNSDMIRDSWGQPQKINRVISGNIVKEEWIYRNTWLYVENDQLVEWGPITR